MRHLVLTDVELLLHGDDGQPHGVPVQQADHVPDTGEEAEHVSSVIGTHLNALSDRWCKVRSKLKNLQRESKHLLG